MEPASPPRISTGIPGLDFILYGGLPEREVYLVAGGPGTGKTTLGLTFLLHGQQQGEKGMYFTFSQSRRSLRSIARSHTWSLDGLEIRELRDERDLPEPQTVFSSSEVELAETLDLIREGVTSVQPDRVVIDTMTDLRLLASDTARYRRELILLRLFLHQQGCTTLVLDDVPQRRGDRELLNQAHGVLQLEQEAPDYGEVRRRLHVLKMRGTPIFSGYHNYRINTGELVVSPRVQLPEEAASQNWEPLSSGIPALDDMLGGGLRRGTACLVAGPSGSGKTAIAFSHAFAATQREQRAAVFLFNERQETFFMRTRSLSMDAKPQVERGLLQVEQVNTGMVTPSEFAQLVRDAVEHFGAEVVVIDSLSGYINAMLNESLLVSQMHELITYLSHRGVLTLLVVDQHGPLTGSSQASSAHMSYLADSVLLLRHMEEGGRRQRTLSVLKQRHGAHAQGAYELIMSDEGLRLGERVDGFAALTLDPPLYALFNPVGSSGDALSAHAPPSA